MYFQTNSYRFLGKIFKTNEYKIQGFEISNETILDIETTFKKGVDYIEFTCDGS